LFPGRRAARKIIRPNVTFLCSRPRLQSEARGARQRKAQP
jgi:hypothetical protein